MSVSDQMFWSALSCDGCDLIYLNKPHQGGEGSDGLNTVCVNASLNQESSLLHFTSNEATLNHNYTDVFNWHFILHLSIYCKGTMLKCA